MSMEHLALAVAIASGVLVPVLLTAVFPWVLSINAKVAVIVEKLTTLAARLEEDMREHEKMDAQLSEHERRLDDHEHRISAVEVRVSD